MAKSKPTPKRKQAEQARLNPIVQSRQNAKLKKLSKEEKKQQRIENRSAIDRQNQAMRTGDERFFPERDKGKVRAYIRDFIDSRHSLGEFFMPFALVLLIFSLFWGFQSADFTVYSSLVVYTYLIIIIVESRFMWRKLKKNLHHKFGVEKVTAEKGLGWYAFMRFIQFRPMRLPKPKYKKKRAFNLK
jgi:hypothetical protein